MGASRRRAGHSLEDSIGQKMSRWFRSNSDVTMRASGEASRREGQARSRQAWLESMCERVMQPEHPCLPKKKSKAKHQRINLVRLRVGGHPPDERRTSSEGL